MGNIIFLTTHFEIKIFRELNFIFRWHWGVESLFLTFLVKKNQVKTNEKYDYISEYGSEAYVSPYLSEK